MPWRSWIPHVTLPYWQTSTSSRLPPPSPSGKGGAARKILLQHLGSAYELLLNRHTKAIAEWSDTDLPSEQRERNIHDVRKAVKRLRYSAEAAGQATGLNTKKLYLACKNLQTLLGDSKTT